MTEKMRGLIAATFAPMRADGALAPELVPAVVDHLVADGVTGLFVSGSTGEGELLTSTERCAIAKAYADAAGDRVSVIVQVGHNSLQEARRLAASAAELPIHAIAAAAPSYFKPKTTEDLAAYLIELSAAAPDLPLYYYHIPGLNHVDLDMVELLAIARDRIPSLIGLKYSALDPIEFRGCLEFDDGRYDIMFGSDEMLLYGLYSGAQAAVGSTYNFAAPLYRGVIDAFDRGDFTAAADLQNKSVRMVAVLLRHSLHPSLKAVMNKIGVPVGPIRLPHRTMQDDEQEALFAELEAIGFFDWGRVHH